MDSLESNKFRVLVSDDEDAYLDLFKQVLSSNSGPLSFELVSCDRADEAVHYVKKSIEQDQPFAVAFLDIRMPSGPDGLWAARQIRALDPQIEIVIITAYSDYAPQEVVSRVPPVHKLIYMQKPFRLHEIQHFAYALSSKWQHELDWLKIHESLEELVKKRTKELSAANKRLEREAFEHKRTAESLKVSEEKYRELFRNESDAVMIFDAETNRIEDANPATLSLFGYSQKEFLQLIIEDIFADKEKTENAVQKATNSDPSSNYVTLSNFIKKDSTVFPGEIYAGTFFSNGREKVIGAVRDVTEQQRTKERLRYLSNSLLAAQEKERKQVAMELHDDFGQSLSILKLDLRHILSKLPKDQENLKIDCENSIQYVDQVLEKVRKLSHGLTPSTLDDLGLSNALRGLVRDFSMHSKIKISCKLKGIDYLFPSMIQLFIYRIFQEALVNILKHSKANFVSITGKKGKREVSFCIEDNGIGFDMARGKSDEIKKSGLGITSIKERVRMMGGQIELTSRVSDGTKIVFRIPFRKGAIYDERLSNHNC